VGADRGDQRAAEEFGERRVRVGVVDQGRQMRLVGHFAAERDRELEGLARRHAQPGGEQRGGRGGLRERGQRDLMAVPGVDGRFHRGVLEDAELVDGALVGRPPVALPQQRTRLDEAQGQTLGLEPQVAGPGDLVLGEVAVDGALQQLQAARAVEPAEEDLFDLRVGGGRGYVGRGGEQEGALGCGVEQLVERAAADLQVVEDDDGTDLADVPEELLVLRAVQRSFVNGGEEDVQEVARGAAVAGEADDAVGREVGAVLGDDVQERAATRAGRAGEPDGAATGEEPYQLLALLLALQQRHLRRCGTGRDGRPGGGGALGPLVGGVLHRRGGTFAGRAELDLAAVDGVHGEQVVTGHDLDGADGRRRRLYEVLGDGVPRRALTRQVAGAVVAVLLGSRVVRIHRSQPPKKRRVPEPLPALLHTAASLLVRCPLLGS
jgi:hypothetical protein